MNKFVILVIRYGYDFSCENFFAIFSHKILGTTSPKNSQLELGMISPETKLGNYWVRDSVLLGKPLVNLVTKC